MRKVGLYVLNEEVGEVFLNAMRYILLNDWFEPIYGPLYCLREAVAILTQVQVVLQI